jgi:hypothetical protein
MAARIARDAEISHAALYARCEHRTAHQLGALFLGTTPGKAASALLYFMGVESNSPPFTQALLDAKLTGQLMSELDERTADLTVRSLSASLARYGAEVSHPRGLAAIQFPYQDGNRSARAARHLAGELKLTP